MRLGKVCVFFTENRFLQLFSSLTIFLCIFSQGVEKKIIAMLSCHDHVLSTGASRMLPEVKVYFNQSSNPSQWLSCLVNPLTIYQRIKGFTDDRFLSLTRDLPIIASMLVTSNFEGLRNNNILASYFICSRRSNGKKTTEGKRKYWRKQGTSFTLFT